MKPWTDEDETVIICLHRKFQVKVISNVLDRSIESVKHRVKQMIREGRLSRR